MPYQSILFLTDDSGKALSHVLRIFFAVEVAATVCCSILLFVKSARESFSTTLKPFVCTEIKDQPLAMNMYKGCLHV